LNLSKLKFKILKKTISAIIFIYSGLIFGQEPNQSTLFSSLLDKLSVNFESNSQWYLNDSYVNNPVNPNQIGEEKLRTTNYLRLDYSLNDRFSAGLQLESYTPENLLNMSKLYDKDLGIATYYLQYQTKSLNLTLGHFYEQFGSGLILRSWEDRFLGINTALRGIRLKINITDHISLTTLYGRQRKGFGNSKGDIFGVNSEINISNMFNLLAQGNLTAGFSYVGKKESYERIQNESEMEIPELVNAFSSRINFAHKNFYTNIEYVTKSKDLRLNPLSPTSGVSFSESKTFKGNALLWTVGYSQKGFGLSYNFRRLENMRWFSERSYSYNVTNPTNQLSINYLPALVKQHDYSLANIYLYQTFPGLTVENYQDPLVKAGEIGQVVDFFYNFKKGSLIGGKYGTKVNLNMSYWAKLETEYNDPDPADYITSDNLTYNSEFLNFKNKLYSDLNLEIRKKWNRKLSSIFTYINLFYDKSYLETGIFDKVRAWIGVIDNTYKFGSGKSFRLELQHLSTNDDARNWMGGTAEFFFNSKFGIYINDSYNYEESNVPADTKVHFYNTGFSYAKGASRLSINYGRQRGGLLCVGGICRQVSPNTGLTLNVTTSF
jgi:hypothetical protein